MTRLFARRLAGFLVMAAAVGFSTSAWADGMEESNTAAAPAENIEPKAAEQGGGYTDKSYHDGAHVYKHPDQPSFTGPFDYGSGAAVDRPAPEPQGRCNCFTFDGTKSYSSDRQKLTYAWDFGDGTTGDQAVMKHCFDKVGDYTVSLTVTDESGKICGNGMAVTKVSPNFPPVAEAGEDKQACLGESVSYTSSSAGASTWDFGDGEKAEGSSVSHVYQKAGTYRVRLTVNDGKNTECSIAQDEVKTEITPRAELKLEGDQTMCVGRTAHFNANGSAISKYTWDFGDGTTSEGGSTASHVYEKSGTYTVRVTGDTGKGGSCSMATDMITVVVNASPIAKAGENLACCVDRETAFDGSGSSSPDGKTLSYHWDFGDGESAEGVRATHAYKKGGTYRVVLTVKDDSGSECSTAMDTFDAKVNTKPEAVIEVR